MKSTMPLGPELVHFMSLLFRINFPDYVAIFHITELVSNCFLGFVIISAGPKRGCLNVGAWNQKESGRKAPLSCDAAFSMSQCSFLLAAAQLLVRWDDVRIAEKRMLQCNSCSEQLSENCSATSVFACAMLQGWGLEGWGLGLADNLRRAKHAVWTLDYITYFYSNQLAGSVMNFYIAEMASNWLWNYFGNGHIESSLEHNCGIIPI